MLNEILVNRKILAEIVSRLEMGEDIRGVNIGAYEQEKIVLTPGEDAGLGLSRMKVEKGSAGGVYVVIPEHGEFESARLFIPSGVLYDMGGFWSLASNTAEYSASYYRDGRGGFYCLWSEHDAQYDYYHVALERIPE
jgi:hypothetical protein